jgi:hypothetical protein
MTPLSTCVVELQRLSFRHLIPLSTCFRSGSAPLHYSSRHGRLEATRLLVECKANVAIRNRYRRSKPHFAHYLPLLPAAVPMSQPVSRYVAVGATLRSTSPPTTQTETSSRIFAASGRLNDLPLLQAFCTPSSIQFGLILVSSE